MPPVSSGHGEESGHTNVFVPTSVDFHYWGCRRAATVDGTELTIPPVKDLPVFISCGLYVGVELGLGREFDTTNRGRWLPRTTTSTTRPTVTSTIVAVCSAPVYALDPAKPAPRTEPTHAAAPPRYHTLVTTLRGQLLAFGAGKGGRLGNGGEEDEWIPRPVIGFVGSESWVDVGTGTGTGAERLVEHRRRAVACSGGDMHSLAVDEDGQVYAFGYNGSGRLGVGDSAPRYEATLVNASSWLA